MEHTGTFPLCPRHFFFKPENDVRGSVKSMPTCLDILLFHLWIKHLSKATSRLLSITVERIRLSEHDHKHQRKKKVKTITLSIIWKVYFRWIFLLLFSSYNDDFSVIFFQVIPSSSQAITCFSIILSSSIISIRET